MSKKIIIIGAGIGGIATANLLAKRGFEVHVYETHSQPGGRAGRLVRGGFTFDTGPSWYLMPGVFERYYSLLDELVYDHLDLIRLNPAYKVFFEDRTSIDITSDIEADAKTFESIEPGSGEALKRYADKASHIYQLSLRHFLYTNFDSVKDLLNPEILKRSLTMLHLALTPIHRYVRSFVKHQKLQQILEYPMVFLGTSPFKAPAIYSLMGALDFKEGVYYPKGGLYTIIESLINIGQKLDVKFHYNCPVEEIVTKGDQAVGIRLDDQIITADIIISNADLPHTETQLIKKAVDRSYTSKYWQKKQASPSALLMYLGISGRIDQLTHHNLLFIDDWQGNFSKMESTNQPLTKASMYICNPNKTDDSIAPSGHENLFVLVPQPADVSLDEEQLPELVDTYLKQIENMTGASITSSIVEQSYTTPDDFSTQYSSWRKSMLGPSHILSQSAFFRTKNKSKKLSNLYYVGAGTLPGIGLPMCLIGAEIVVDRITKDLSHA